MRKMSNLEKLKLVWNALNTVRQQQRQMITVNFCLETHLLNLWINVGVAIRNFSLTGKYF